MNEIEPNSSITQATLLPLDTTATGYISSKTDVDFYEFTANKTGTYSLSFKIPNTYYSSSYAYFNLSIYDKDGLVISTTSAKQGEIYQFSAISGEDYYASISSAYANIYNNENYSLLVSGDSLVPEASTLELITLDPTKLVVAYSYDHSNITGVYKLITQLLYDSNGRIIDTNYYYYSSREKTTDTLTLLSADVGTAVIAGDGEYYLPNITYRYTLMGDDNSPSINFKIDTGNADANFFALQAFDINAIGEVPDDLPVTKYTDTLLVFGDARYKVVFTGNFSDALKTGSIRNGSVYSYEVKEYGVSKFVVFGSWNLNKFDTAQASSAKLSALILAGNDYLSGSSGADNLFGLAGNDNFIPNAGNDSVDGGLGTDTCTYSGTSSNYTLSIVSGGFIVTDNSGTDGTDFLANIERIEFTDIVIALPIVGSSLNEKLPGTADNDEIYGYAGNDTLTGLAGNDTLDGGAGDDSMTGGAGNDTYIADSIKDKIIEKANEGSDTVISSATSILANNVENLTLFGVLAINATGNTANNTVTGNNADNSINGGLGNDTLIGGLGNDTFVFNSKLGLTNIDTISDFTSGDKIALAGSIFSKLKGDKDLSDNFKAAALDSNDYLIYDSANGKLYYDADGLGTKSQPIQIALIGTDTHTTLSASDFVIV